MTKEEVYDKEIHPMVNQILEICKTYQIQMLCSFTLELDDKNGDILSTTYLKGSEVNREIEIAKNVIIRELTKENVIHDYIGTIL